MASPLFLTPASIAPTSKTPAVQVQFFPELITRFVDMHDIQLSYVPVHLLLIIIAVREQ